MTLVIFCAEVVLGKCKCKIFKFWGCHEQMSSRLNRQQALWRFFLDTQSALDFGENLLDQINQIEVGQTSLLLTELN